MTPLPKGVWPVMLTPFESDGALARAGVDRLTDWYLEAGVSGLFAVCQSSEMYDLLDDERLALARRVVGRAEGRVPVVASGTFGGSIETQAGFVRRMADTGVDAVVCLACQLAGQSETDDVWRGNAERLLALTDDIPLGIYECPLPYHRVLPAELMGWATSTGRFLFLKETSARLKLIEAKICATDGSPFRLYNANTLTLLSSLGLGAAGFSGTAANFYPKLLVWLCAHFGEEPETAERLQRFLTIAQDLIGHKYPQSAKEFLAQAGMQLDTTCRVCDHPFDEEELGKLAVLYEEADSWHGELGLGSIL